MAQLSGRQISYIEGTVLAGGTLSNELNLSEYAILGFHAIDSLVAGTLNFKVAEKSSVDSGQYNVVRDFQGNIKQTGSLSGKVSLAGDDLAFLAPYAYVRIEFGAAQTNGLRFVIPVKV